MNILCIDTCNGLVNLAIIHNESQYFYTSRDTNSQAENIALDIELILKQAKLKISDIKNFAINLGPGSFMGCRIGLGYLSGIMSFSDVIISTIDTFDIAFCAENIADAVVLIRADVLGGVFLKEYINYKKVNDIRYLPNFNINNFSGKNLIIDDKINASCKNSKIAQKHDQHALLKASIYHSVVNIKPILQPVYMKTNFDI